MIGQGTAAVAGQSAAALLDEVAFWHSDGSAQPDHEIIAALRPALTTIPGALLLAGAPGAPLLAKYMAAIAVFFATINVVGGFLVTHRMLDMFRKK